MTRDERDLVEEIGEIFNMIVRLPKQHPSDISEAQFHIHALQNIILARDSYRQLHNLYDEDDK